MLNEEFQEFGEFQEESLVSLRLLTRNIRLVAARKAKGLTQRQAAELLGLRLHKLSQIENLRCVPSYNERSDIAAYLEKSIDYLFPPMLISAIEKGVFHRRDAQLAEPEIISLTEAEQLRLAYDGENEIIDEVDRHLLQEEVKQVLETLDPREARFIELRLGFKDGQSRSCEEVGREFRVTRERIRQIEAKALRKLRHPTRSLKLKDYLE